MTSDIDFYELLECDRAADGAMIKSAYRKLAMKYHPDKNAGCKDSEARFKAVSEAYDVLKDPQKRAAYDRFGHAAFRQGQGGGEALLVRAGEAAVQLLVLSFVGRQLSGVEAAFRHAVVVLFV